VQLFDKEGAIVSVLDPALVQVGGPNGVAWSAGRDLYIADTIQSKLHKLTLAPDNSLQAVGSVPVEGQNALEQCLDAAVDPTGRVYMVDIKDRILRISPDGTATVYSLPVGKASGGSRLAVSPDGSRLYMSDPDRNRVAVLDTLSGSLSYFGEPGTGPGQFGEPSGVAVGADGRVYVLDRANNNIQVFAPPK
jgi:DNA-binding beta-propeller fold protein YncE